MAKQHQKPRARDQPACHGRIQRLQLRKFQKLSLQFGQQRQQQHGNKRLDRECAPQLAQGEPVKGQVQHKENLAKADTRGVVQQERKACGSPGQQACAGEKSNPYGNEQHAGEDGHSIFRERVRHHHRSGHLRRVWQGRGVGCRRVGHGERRRAGRRVPVRGKSRRLEHASPVPDLSAVKKRRVCGGFGPGKLVAPWLFFGRFLQSALDVTPATHSDVGLGRQRSCENSGLCPLRGPAP